MSLFLDAVRERVLLGDGAMGTEIMARGVPIGQPYGLLNLSKPDLIRGIHHDYLAAGAEVHRTNTFTANRVRLETFGLEGNIREFNLAAVKLAREVVGKGAFVAGSVGPLSDASVAWGEKRDAYREQIELLAEGGCDLLVLETFTDLEDLRIAIESAREAVFLPVVAEMAFPKKRVAVRDLRMLERLKPDVFGVNCSSPMRTLQLLERVARRSKTPLAAFPSAGREDDAPNRISRGAVVTGRRLAASGVHLVGGCCGVGPESIERLAEALRDDTRSPDPVFPLSVLFANGNEVTLEDGRDPETELEFFSSRGEGPEVVVLDSLGRRVHVEISDCTWRECRLVKDGRRNRGAGK